MEDRYWAVIDQDGYVVNIVVWDGTTYDAETNPRGWTPPDMTLIEVFGDERDGADVGGRYDGTFHPNLTPPEPTPEPSPPPIDIQQLQQILLDKGVITVDDLTAT